MYDGTVALESSDVFDPVSNTYSPTYIDLKGNECDTRVELTLTMIDYKLFLEHS